MKHSLLALAATALLATSSVRAEYLNTESDVISLPAFVVEATRVDLPSADLALSNDFALRSASAFADRASDRALDRLKARLSGGGRQLVRHPSAGGRPRA